MLLQVAAERRQKAIRRRLPSADNAAAPLAPSLAAAEMTPAATDGSIEGCSPQSRHEDQEPPQPKETAAASKELSQNSSGSNHAEGQPGESEGNTKSPKSPHKPQIESSSIVNGNHKQEDGNISCTGHHDAEHSGSSEPVADSSGSKSTRAVQSTLQVTEAGSNGKAASQTAMQERQQRVMQFLIEGCDELADNQQQVR